MRVPIEGQTPGLRYGHSLVYIAPILILFGGSGRNEILSDVWVLSTDKTPFRWEKVNAAGKTPIARVYHTATVFKVSGNTEMMSVFGGRDTSGKSLTEVHGLKKDSSDWEWVELSNKESSNDVTPVGRHQHCSTFFGPFLFVVGGRTEKDAPTFDVFSMNKMKWHRFGNVALFRHSICVYYNITSQNKYEVFLFIYGGFDGDNNSMINPSLFKVNIVDLFSLNESLKNELNEYISMLLLSQNIKKSNKNITQVTTNNNSKTVEKTQQFNMSGYVVAAQPNENNEFANNIRQLSLAKLNEEAKKIGDVQNHKKKYVYDVSLIREFIQLMPLPEHFQPLNKNDRPIILNKDYISSLISQAKQIFEKLPHLIKLKYPIKIFGSINGQYNDLIRFFNFWGRPHEHKGDIETFEYLFLGNFVNRGGFSLEVLLLLLALKVK